MNEDISLTELVTQKENVIHKIMEEQGADGLRHWLLTYSEPDLDWDLARRALNLLFESSPLTWPEDLVKIAIESVSDVIHQRVLHWELGSLIHQLDESGCSSLISSIRSYMTGSKLDWAVRASRCMWVVGYAYDGASEDMSSLFYALPDGSEDKAVVINIAAYLGVISNSLLKSEIWKQINSDVGYNKTLAFLLANHGDEEDFEYLQKHFDANPHDVLMAMLQMCLRLPEVRESTLNRFLTADQSIRWGLDHFAVRVFGSSDLIKQYLDSAFSALEDGHAGLPEMTRLKTCVREDHLGFLGNLGGAVTPKKMALLEKLTTGPSGHLGLMNSHSTFRKEAAIGLSSRLGLAALREWLPKGMFGEVNRSLIQRMAQDCCFFDVKDFILPLQEVLKIEGDHTPEGVDNLTDGESSDTGGVLDNPMWLVSDEAGVSGGEATLMVLLQSDGRHGMEQPLMSYVEGLAFAAVNVGSTRLLTDAMVDDSQPYWRRGAAAHAVRTAALYIPAPSTDWLAAEKYVSDPSQNEFARHELLIALAEHDPETTKKVFVTLSDRERTLSQVLLAQIIAKIDLDSAIKTLGSFLSPVKYPHRRSFEEAYAAICIARLYREHALSSAEVAAYLRSGLQHELAQFCISCEEIREDDDELFDVIMSGTIERNSGWSSHPVLWQSLGRYRPQRLLSAQAMEHVVSTSDSSIKGYIDALIEQRDQFGDEGNKIWVFLFQLMRDQSRAVGWYASFASALLCPVQTRAFVDGNLDDDLQIRTALECATWLDPDDWATAFKKAQKARWRLVTEYATELASERERLRLADVYLRKIQSSGDRLRDWRFAQATLQLPSEMSLIRLKEFQVKSIQDGYLTNWLVKNISNALKSREKLFEKSRLPGEDAFPRWF